MFVTMLFCWTTCWNVVLNRCKTLPDLECFRVLLVVFVPAFCTVLSAGHEVLYEVRYLYDWCLLNDYFAGY